MSDEGDDRFALERELQETSEIMNHTNALMELLEGDGDEDTGANMMVVDDNSDDSLLKKPGAYSVDQGRTELLQDSSSKLGSKKGRDQLIIPAAPDENAAKGGESC